MLQRCFSAMPGSYTCVCFLLVVSLAGCHPSESAAPTPAASPTAHAAQPVSPSQPFQASTPVVQTVNLADIPTNQTLFVTWDQIVALNQEVSPSQITYATVQDSSHFGSPQWTLIKFRNDFYIRGYRVYDEEQSSKDWFTSTRMDGHNRCESKTVPIRAVKDLTGPPEVTDSEEKYETVLLPEDISEDNQQDNP